MTRAAAPASPTGWSPRSRPTSTPSGRARTRYQRYSCVHGFGHAFSRIYNAGLEPALHLCHALGERAAPDCAQGAYHDYWFAIEGLDDAGAGGAAQRPARAVRYAAARVRA